MALIGLRRYRGDRSEMIRQSARLFLLLAASLTLALYIHGGAPVYMDIGGKSLSHLLMGVCPCCSVATVASPIALGQGCRVCLAPRCAWPRRAHGNQ